MGGTCMLLNRLRSAHRRPARAPVPRSALHFRPRRRRSWPMVVVTGASEAEGPHPARRLQESSHRSRLLLLVPSSSPPPPRPSAVDRLWIGADVVTTYTVAPFSGGPMNGTRDRSYIVSPPRRRASHPRPPPSARSMRPCPVCTVGPWGRCVKLVADEPRYFPTLLQLGAGVSHLQCRLAACTAV